MNEDRPKRACDTGRPVCDRTPARLYPCGWRCDKHAPTPRRMTPAGPAPAPTHTTPKET